MSSKTLPKLGNKVVNNGVEKKRVSPLEDAFRLASLLEISLLDKSAGAYLLKKGKNIQVKFGFECQGIHPTMRSELVEPTFEQLEAGLKDIPEKEDLTFHLSSFVNDSDRQSELSNLVQENSDSTALQFLLMSEQKRVGELTQRGIRKKISLTVYCTYTVSGESTYKDPIKNFLAQAEKQWKKYTGVLDTEENEELVDLLTRAFTDGFSIWSQILNDKMGLNCRPLSAQELWSNLWQRFNSSKPREIPQLLILDERGLTEQINSQLHPVTLLMESADSVPVADRQWVNCKGKYVGVCTLSSKPAGWKDCLKQLRYIWSAIANERIFDTEVIFQMRKGNQSMLHRKMHSITKQAFLSEKWAAEKNNVDVSASLKREKAIAAQKELYEDSVPFRTANVFLVHRSKLPKLNEAIKQLCAKFNRPAWLLRETEYAWKIWLETFPIYWGKLMTKPFDRRMTYLNSEVPGLIPIVKNHSSDTSGLELIAEEGGSPIYLDLYGKNQLKNILICGTTRSGKTALAAGLISTGLARGLPVVAIDFPKKDGSGSFSEYANFLGDRGAYFDISSESSNLFELPDLSGLPPKIQDERFLDYKEDLSEIVLMMVMGQSHHQTDVNRDIVRSLLVLGLEKFFSDPRVREAYVEAHRGGIGSAAWKQIPTLERFESFLSLERLELTAPDRETISTLSHIKLRLKFWLNSRVGKAIGRPSTFSSNAQFLCVALRNLSNSEDAAVLASNVWLLGLRRSLASEESIFFLDEAPIFFEYDSLASLVARQTGNGAKSGIRVILNTQSPEGIARSQFSPQILQNINTRLIGRIEPTAIDSFVETFKYPREIISANATKGFFPSKQGIYSKWLLDNGGIYTFTRFYPSYGLLALIANNKHEAHERKLIMSQYDDPIRGIHAYSQHLVAQLSQSA